MQCTGSSEQELVARKMEEVSKHNWMRHFAALRANPELYHPNLPEDFSTLLSASKKGAAGVLCIH